MRKCAMIIAGVAFAALATGCAQLSEWTGTTLSQRCVAYQTALARMEARVEAGELTEKHVDDLRAIVEAVCALPEPTSSA